MISRVQQFSTNLEWRETDLGAQLWPGSRSAASVAADVLVDRHAPKPQPHSEAVPAVVALRELYVEFAIVLQPVNFV